MMQNLFKITTLIVVLFVAVAVSSCRTPDNNADDDNNVYNDSFEPAPLPEPLKNERKTYSRKDAKAEFKGKEEELYTNFNYPSYWSLKKSPGKKEIPGVDKVERWCKFRLESLDASIEITVLDGVRDLDEMIPQIKKQILDRYSLKSFLESPPKLIEIDGVKVEGAEEDGKVSDVDRIDGDNEESLPKYKFAETQSKPQTTTDKPNLENSGEMNTFRSNFELNMLLDDDDDLDFGDDDDDDMDDDDDLDFGDDDDDDADDDLDFGDDDDDDADDDLDFGDDDDDMGDDDDDSAVEEKDTTEKSNGSKIFKRNEKWVQGKEMWVKTSSLYIEKHKIKVLEYEGRFVYDQKLYLVKVYAVNRIKDNKTYYSVFVCEAENFVRYETEYTETVQSVKFKTLKASE